MSGPPANDDVSQRPPESFVRVSVIAHVPLTVQGWLAPVVPPDVEPPEVEPPEVEPPDVEPLEVFPPDVEPPEPPQATRASEARIAGQSVLPIVSLPVRTTERKPP